MRTTILSLLALAATMHANAQTIGEVLESVSQNNLELKAMLHGNEAATLDMKTDNTLEDLSVEYSPFFSRNVGGVASSELIVSQGFDFPTLYGARRKANRLQGEVLEMEYLTARRDILLAAKTVCLDLIHINKRQQLLDERRKNADELLASCTEKNEKGEATSLELNKVKMERMTLNTELAQAEAERSAALQQLCALNGGTPISIDQTEYPLPPADGYEAMVERVVNADLPTRKAQAAVRAAEQAVKVNKQSWLPKLEVGYRRNAEGDEAVNGFLVGGSIPLFSSKNKVKTAKARQTEAELMQADARVEAESEARTLLDETRQLRAAADAYDVPLMRQTLVLLRKAVDNGEISVTDYYTEADAVYRNMQAYLELERQYQGVIAELMKNEL